MARRLAIKVNHAVCMGNGQCVFLAPAVFRHNDDLQSEVVDPAAASEELILKAASSCPTGAIEVVDADTGEILFPA